MAKKINVFSIIAGCFFGVCAFFYLYQYFRYNFDFYSLIVFVSLGLMTTSLFVCERILFITGSGLFLLNYLVSFIKSIFPSLKNGYGMSAISIIFMILYIFAYASIILICLDKKRASMWGIISGIALLIALIANIGLTIYYMGLPYGFFDSYVAELIKSYLFSQFTNLYFYEVIILSAGCIFAGLAIKKQWKNSIVEGEQ